MNKNIICSEVVGLVGEPFSIETTSQFDTATLTFKIDQSMLGETEFDNLMFLWYDKENYEFVELETFYDYENSTVSIETTHFSRYMVVDKYLWYEAWAVEFNYNPAETLRLALQKISSNGDTSFNAAISTSINAFNADDIGVSYTNNRIILLSDGGSSVSDSILDTAKSKNIKIYTIGLGSSSNDTRLEYIADYTGGEFFKEYTADELIDIYTEVGINSDFDTTDTDGDGLYDAVETAGIRLQNGVILKNNPETDTFYANPTKLDTDGDGLNDGVEIDPAIRWKSGSVHSGQREYFFVMLSNPSDKATCKRNNGIGNFNTRSTRNKCTALES